MSEGDAIPEFSKTKAGEGHDVSLTNLSAFASGPGIRSGAEFAAIIAVAVVIIGGIELALRLFNVPHYIMPGPSAIAYALYDEFPLIAPHLGYTLVELVSGFSIGAIIGLVMAAVITQFPFAEKIVAPYILILVTTPMLALVPLLILRFGFGYTPRIIAVALAAGPMVMINAA
ncbi:MAG: ABC transporter permease, partial [Mesorhizobium sp.]